MEVAILIQVYLEILIILRLMMNLLFLTGNKLKLRAKLVQVSIDES